MERWRHYWDDLSLWARFRVLFLAAYVPVLLFGSALMVELYVIARQSYFEQVNQQAQLAYVSVDRWYSQQRALAAMVAKFPEVRGGPSPEAYRFLSWIGEGVVGWAGISMLDGSGRVVLSTLRPYGSPPVDLNKQTFVERALRTGQPVISGFTDLGLGEGPAITLISPYAQAGERRALAIHFDPDFMGDFFLAAPFQEKILVSLVDLEGHRIARSQVPGPPGELIESEGIRFAITHPRGEAIVRWMDGVDRITAVYHHPPSRWIVSAGLPVRDSLALIRRMLFAILGIGLVGFGLVFWMILLGIRQASQPIALLADKAQRLKDGHLSERVPPLPSQELRGLGESFNEMAEQLQQSHASLEAQVEDRTRELTEALEKLKTLDRLKDTFLSTISHEMKTPLSLIIGYTELLQEKYPTEELLKRLQDGSRRLTTHINNMLDYSALLGGSLPLYKTEVSIPEVARNALDIMDTEFQVSNLHVEAHLDPTVPPVYGDSRRITQMFLELLDNARKYTPAGGRIGVEVTPHDHGVRIEVWDTGIGIKPEDLGRIWEAFNQVETGEALRKGGLGLGLTIVKKLAELHHGRVGVQSQPGQGSRFTIDLPANGLE